MNDKKYPIIVASVITVVGLVLLFWTPREHGPYPPAMSLQDGFEFQEQPDQISCGPTSAAMLLQYYGKSTTIQDIKVVAKNTWFKYGENDEEFGMTIPENLLKAVNHFLVKSKMRVATMRDVIKYINEKRPPLVLVRSGQLTWHWVVVIGYDPEHITVADPGWGRARKMTRAEFEGAWAFTHDMRGNKMATECPACGGDGKLWNLPGPLGNCDACGGSGDLPDVMKKLVESADVYGNTLIVPN
tara:strand:- start:1963 stop:2691 length:729 start_codon:yes stop_codon:yes gene_type:complete